MDFRVRNTKKGVTQFLDSDDEEILERNKHRQQDFDPVRDQVFELSTDQLLAKGFFEVE